MKNEIMNYEELPKLFNFCENLSKSNLLPDSYKNKPSDVLVTIQYGKELGMTPMIALNQIFVVKGKPTLSGSAMSSMILNSGVGYFEVHEKDENGCKIHFVRTLPTGREITLDESFTMKDAKRAGLASGTNWVKYPEQMCYNRCLSKGARILFSDIIGGAYIQGEIPEDDNEELSSQIPLETKEKVKPRKTKSKPKTKPKVERWITEEEHDAKVKKAAYETPEEVEEAVIVDETSEEVEEEKVEAEVQETEKEAPKKVVDPASLDPKTIKSMLDSFNKELKNARNTTQLREIIISFEKKNNIETIKDFEVLRESARSRKALIDYFDNNVPENT